MESIINNREALATGHLATWLLLEKGSSLGMAYSHCLEDCDLLP